MSCFRYHKRIPKKKEIIIKSLIFSFAILVVAFIPMDETINTDFDASEVQEVVTIDNMDKAISADTFVNPCSDAFADNSDTCKCIASGSCKFRVESSCKIVMCDGEVLEDDTNSTVDNSKIVTVQYPCKEEN